MKALVKTKAGPGNVELIDVDEPVPNSNEVKIKVFACGVCGTDLHVLHATTIYAPGVILGHEFSGVITEVGSNVKRFKPGDRVVAETTVESCGYCQYCIAGDHNICANRRGLGRTGDGAFASYLILRQQLIHILPDSVELDEAALLEPLACTVHAVIETGTVHAGDRVFVSGPGGIGLFAMQVAKAEGARVVIAGMTRDAERLALAKQLGADRVVNLETENIEDIMNEETNGIGFDIVIECSGSAAAVGSSLKLIRRQGQFIQMGLSGKEIPVNFDLVVNREIRILGSVNSKWTSWERAIKLLASKKVVTKPMISQVLPLENWEIAFDNMKFARGVKTLLIPSNQ
jgi:L-iditol 2-dehydrogenase